MKHKIKHNHWGDKKVWDGDSRRAGNPDRALLLAVLDQAFQDLRRHLRPVAKARTAKHQKGEDDYYAGEAYDWFNYKRYTWLCDLIDVSPDAVEMRFKQIVREAHERNNGGRVDQERNRPKRYKGHVGRQGRLGA